MASLTLLAGAEVCERLGIDRSTLNRWVASGRIHAAYKTPGLRGANLFRPSEVARVRALLNAENAVETRTTRVDGIDR